MRGIVISFLLLFSLSVNGQFVIDSYRFGGGVSADLLLDSFPGAAFAYSLRKLDKDYAGNCITVRRSSNNDTTSIGFFNNYLDTVALKTFCGTGGSDTCFVRVWLDQSGNGRNAVQTTSLNQPEIMINGAIVYGDGSPSLNFTASPLTALRADSFGLAATSAISGFYTYSSTAAAAANTNTAFPWNLGNAGVSSRVLTHGSSTGALAGETMFYDVREAINGGSRLGSSTYARSANQNVVESTIFISSGTTFQQNNSAVTLGLTTGGGSTTKDYTGLGPYGNLSSPFIIGGIISNSSLALSADQKITEMIFYGTDETTNRTAINTNINNFYQIY
jgi:hypothetical protein